MYVNGERVMAWIAKINKVEKHPNADALDICTVGGWKCITKLGEFIQGDLAVYLSIDSWVPHEIAPFLSKGKEPREYNGVKGERLRTARLRKQISQGLLLPLTVINPRMGSLKDHLDNAEGFDCSELLNIQKWEKPIPPQLQGQVKGNFPTQIPKTDQERVQNLISEGSDFFVGEWEVSMKLDGSSMTLFKLGEDVGVCSRNVWLKDNKENDGNTFVKLARNVDYAILLPEIAKKIGFDFALQGELMGPGVQGNRENFDDHRFFVFDIYNITDGNYLTPSQRQKVIDEIKSITPLIDHVPVLHDSFHITEENSSLDHFLEMAEVPSINHKYAEGIVFKNLHDGNKSFKAISNRFLLKEE